MSRRRFLTGILALGLAPALVKAKPQVTLGALRQTAMDMTGKRFFVTAHPSLEADILALPGFLKAENYPFRTTADELGAVENFRFFRSERVSVNGYYMVRIAR